MSDPFFWLLLFHLLGAAIWVGGHLVLALRILPRALKTADVAAIRDFEGAFEAIGLPAFAVQIVTGIWMALALVPLAGWLDLADPMARAIQLKLACLLASLLLALHARLRIIPGLRPETLPALAWHIRLITLVAVGFVIAVAAIRVGGLAL